MQGNSDSPKSFVPNVESTESARVSNIHSKLLRGDSIPSRSIRIESLLHAAEFGLFEWDLSTDGVWFCPVWKAQIGFVEHEFPDKLADWSDRVHPDDRVEFFKSLREISTRQNFVVNREYRLLHRDGGWKWFSLRAHANIFETGHQAIVTCLQIDITREKVAEEELRQSDERIRYALEATSDGIWDWNIATGDVYFSPQWANLLGYSPDEVPDRVEFFYEILHPSDIDRVGQLVNDHLAGLSFVKQDEVRLRMKSGEYRWFLDRGKVVSRDASGAPLRMAGTITDITEKKKFERSISAYARLAHDLNRANTVKEVSRRIASAADDLIGWDSAVLVMFDDADETRYSVLNIDIVEGERREIPTSPTDERLAYRVRETRTQGAQLILRHDPEELVDYVNSAGESCRASASLMFVPIRDGNSIVGMLSIQSYFQNAYVEADLETLQILADYCGGTISRILSRDALHESEAWLREAQSISHIGNFRWDARTGALKWSEELFRIYGKDPACFKPSFEAYIEGIHPADRPRIVETLHRVMGSKGKFNHDYRLMLQDGSIRWVGARGVALVDANGELTGLEGTCQDITERKQTETSLRQSEEKFRTLYENLGDAIFLLSDGVFQDCNAKTLLMFACDTRDQILGKHPSVFSTPTQADGRNSFECVNERIELAMAGNPQFFEWIHTKLDGTPFPAEVSLNALELGDKRFLQAIVRDITERKRFEEKLRQSHKMEAIGLLAGGVAHDFNNLLTVINGFCDILMAQQDQDTPEWEPLTAIREAGERAADLTSQLLAFSRKAIVELKILDLNEQLETTFRMLRRLIGAHIRLDTKLDRGLAKIKIDPGQLDQVVMNLAVNAHDAMPRGGVFTITTRNLSIAVDGTPGECVELNVSDTGEGMSEEVRNRIFEPFFTTKGLGKGTGLGLATVHGIISQAGGTIVVHSKSGVGTTFQIRLPAIHEKVNSEKIAADIGSGPRGAETILLAEDEPGVRRLAKLCLETLGYTVIEADSGPMALKLSKSFNGSIELLISDVVMPDQSGRDLAEEIRESRPETRVLFVSGYTDDEVFRHGVELSRDSFLQKPFSIKSLAAKVREVLDAKISHAIS